MHTKQHAVCRFVVILTEHPDYFFWLYIVYTALQGWLALLALVHFPHGSGLELKSAPEGFEYVVSSCPPSPRSHALSNAWTAQLGFVSAQHSYTDYSSHL